MKRSKRNKKCCLSNKSESQETFITAIVLVADIQFSTRFCSVKYFQVQANKILYFSPTKYISTQSVNYWPLYYSLERRERLICGTLFSVTVSYYTFEEYRVSLFKEEIVPTSPLMKVSIFFNPKIYKIYKQKISTTEYLELLCI